jgi:hypothetical protein
MTLPISSLVLCRLEQSGWIQGLYLRTLPIGIPCSISIEKHVSLSCRVYRVSQLSGRQRSLPSIKPLQLLISVG